MFHVDKSISVTKTCAAVDSGIVECTVGYYGTKQVISIVCIRADSQSTKPITAVPFETCKKMAARNHVCRIPFVISDMESAQNA